MAASQGRCAVAPAEGDRCEAAGGGQDLRVLTYRVSLEVISRSLDASLRDFLR